MYIIYTRYQYILNLKERLLHHKVKINTRKMEPSKYKLTPKKKPYINLKSQQSEFWWKETNLILCTCKHPKDNPISNTQGAHQYITGPSPTNKIGLSQVHTQGSHRPQRLHRETEPFEARRAWAPQSRSNEEVHEVKRSSMIWLDQKLDEQDFNHYQNTHHYSATKQDHRRETDQTKQLFKLPAD